MRMYVCKYVHVHVCVYVRELSTKKILQDFEFRLTATATATATATCFSRILGLA